MKAVIIGSGSSWPDPERSGPSQVITVGKVPLLFDCGPGTGMNLMKAGINPVMINKIFLTHFHMDHCLELPSLVFQSYLMGKQDSVDVYGPMGTMEFCRLQFEKVYPYAPEVVQKIRKEGLEVVPHEAAEGLVCETEDYRVLGAPAEHGVSSIAFRLETKEGVVAITGNTRPCKSVVELARGADMLIQECSFPDDSMELAQITFHSTASDAGEIASQAGVKKLVLTHLFPQTKGREKEIIKSANRIFNGEVILSHDLQEISVKNS